MTDVWTEERIGRFRELFLDPVTEWSFSEMAAKLGEGLTRNACIGKAHRLGLERNCAGQKPKPHKVKAPRKGRMPLPPGAPKFNPQPFVCSDPVDIVPLNICFHDLQDGDCRFPYDAPAGSYISHVFCGHPALTDKPYCVGHHAVASVGIPTRKPAVASPSEFGKSRGGVFGRVA